MLSIAASFGPALAQPAPAAQAAPASPATSTAQPAPKSDAPAARAQQPAPAEPRPTLLQRLKDGVAGLYERARAMAGLATAGPTATVPPGTAAPAAGGRPAGPPPTVTVSQPVKRPVVEWDEYTARFDAVETVEMRARVSGYLTEVHFKDGQMVAKGDLLFTIDRRPFERVLEQAQAELAQAQTKVENAAKDVERGRPLLDRKILSEKVFDDRENLMRDAAAAVRVAEAKVKTAELDLSFTRVTSPVAGRISRAIVSVGNYVAGGTLNSTLLTTIVSQDPIHLYFDVSENNTIKYKRLVAAGQRAGAAAAGATIEFSLADERGFPHRGTLDFSDNRLDPATGTLRARAVVDNKAGLFSPGMFARVRIAGSARYEALLLPDEAIGTDQTAKFVYVVADDGTAARKALELGPMIEGLRIVRAGLEAGDWVVTKGVQRARPGQKVTPKREPIKVSATSPID
jgi:RND family efflux transporter MFP subunit